MSNETKTPFKLGKPREEEAIDPTEETINLTEPSEPIDPREELSEPREATRDRDHLPTPLPHQTKHAAYIAKLLGPTAKVLDFDKVRLEIKSTRKPSKTKRKEHDLLLQANIQHIKTNTLGKIRQVEHDYFCVHKTLPTDNTSSELAHLTKTCYKNARHINL